MGMFSLMLPICNKIDDCRSGFLVEDQLVEPWEVLKVLIRR